MLPKYKVIKRMNKVFKITDDFIDGQAVAIAELTPSKHWMLMRPKYLDSNSQKYSILSLAELDPSRAGDTGLITSAFSMNDLECTHISGFESQHLYVAFMLCDSAKNSKLVVLAIPKKNIYKKEHFVKKYDLSRGYNTIRVDMIDDTNYSVILGKRDSQENLISMG